MLKTATPGQAPKQVTILGLTFKENVPDLRNTKVVDVIAELANFGMSVQVHDAEADPAEAEHEYALQLTSMDQLEPADAVIVAVAHRTYVDGGWDFVKGLLKDGRGVVADVRGVLDRTQVPDGITLWRL